MTDWLDAGPADELARRPLQQVRVGRRPFAVSFVDGAFHVIDGRCNHVGGPLGDGALDDDGYVTCPWHNWKFHHATGCGEPGSASRRPTKGLSSGVSSGSQRRTCSMVTSP